MKNFTQYLLAYLTLIPLIGIEIAYVAGKETTLDVLTRVYRSACGIVRRYWVRYFRSEVRHVLDGMRRESTSQCLKKYGEAID